MTPSTKDYSVSMGGIPEHGEWHYEIKTMPAVQSKLKTLPTTGADVRRSIVDDIMSQGIMGGYGLSAASMESASLFKTISERDIDGRMAKLLKSVVEELSLGRIDDFETVLIDSHSRRFWSLFESFKQHPVNDSQVAAMRRFTEIEARTKQYKWLSPSEALARLGRTSTNPSRDIQAMAKRKELMIFQFGNSSARIPLFQFSVDEPAVAAPVPEILKYLGHLDDWSLFDWLSTPDSSIDGTPIEAISNQDKHEALVKYARFFCASLMEDD